MTTFPLPLPEEDGYYWALLLWEFNVELRTVVFVCRPTGELATLRPLILVAATFSPEPWLHTREIIAHDVLRWGPKLEFPPIPAPEAS